MLQWLSTSKKTQVLYVTAVYITNIYPSIELMRRMLFKKNAAKSNKKFIVVKIWGICIAVNHTSFVVIFSLAGKCPLVRLDTKCHSNGKERVLIK